MNRVSTVLSFFLGAFLTIAGHHPITQKGPPFQKFLTPRRLPHYSITPSLHYFILSIPSLHSSSPVTPSFYQKIFRISSLLKGSSSLTSFPSLAKTRATPSLTWPITWMGMDAS